MARYTWLMLMINLELMNTCIYFYWRFYVNWTGGDMPIALQESFFTRALWPNFKWVCKSLYFLFKHMVHLLVPIHAFCSNPRFSWVGCWIGWNRCLFGSRFGLKNVGWMNHYSSRWELYCYSPIQTWLQMKLTDYSRIT